MLCMHSCKDYFHMPFMLLRRLSLHYRDSAAVRCLVLPYVIRLQLRAHMSISSPCTITHLPNELIQLIIVDFDRNEHGKLAWCCSKVCRLFRQILLKWAWKEISIDLRSPKFDNTINSIPEWAHVYAKRIHVCDKWSDRRLKSTIEDGHIEHMCTRLPGVTVFVWDSHARLTDAELTALPQHAKVWVTSYAYIEHLVDDYFVPPVLNPIVRKKISKVQLDVHNRLTLHGTSPHRRDHVKPHTDMYVQSLSNSSDSKISSFSFTASPGQGTISSSTSSPSRCPPSPRCAYRL
jgi:hypothetical protein